MVILMGKGKFVYIKINLYTKFGFIYDFFRYSTVQLKLMKWQHLAMTLNGNIFNIYIDGKSVLASNANSPRQITRTNAYIGRSNWGDAYGDFEIDDLKIFNRSLTNSEIVKIMNSYY